MDDTDARKLRKWLTPLENDIREIEKLIEQPKKPTGFIHYEEPEGECPRRERVTSHLVNIFLLYQLAEKQMTMVKSPQEFSADLKALSSLAEDYKNIYEERTMSEKEIIVWRLDIKNKEKLMASSEFVHQQPTMRLESAFGCGVM